MVIKTEPAPFIIKNCWHDLRFNCKNKCTTLHNSAVHKTVYTLSKCGHKNASDSGDTCQLPQLLEIVFSSFQALLWLHKQKENGQAWL